MAFESNEYKLNIIGHYDGQEHTAIVKLHNNIITTTIDYIKYSAN